MPKDQWLADKRKRSAKKSRCNGPRKPKYVKTPNPRVLPAGCDVLIRKAGSSDDFKWYKTKKDIAFGVFLAATKKSLLIEVDGWHLWVPQLKLKICR